MTGSQQRRCFLFAAYYPTSKVDKADLYHLEQLSRLGDVYYFVDCDYFSPREIAKVQPYAKHVGWEKHGEYDFGSWKRLYSLVQAQSIPYDEVYLINNSCYLVNSLEKILQGFEESDAEFFAPCLIDDNYRGQNLHYEDYLNRFSAYHDNAMFPSIFLGFKRELLLKPFIRNFFASIKRENDRLAVCTAYERGLTRTLLRYDVKFRLAYPFVLKNSYIYSRDSFTLVREGFPYLKRKVLSQDFYEFDLPKYRLLGLLKNVNPRISEIIDADHARLCNTTPLVADSIFIDEIFDAEWYLDKYEDVRNAGIGALAHFLKFGILEYRQPCEWLALDNHAWGFPSKDPTVFVSFLNHLESFFKHDFDANWYEKEYASIIPAGTKALRHYFERGWEIGCLPYPGCTVDLSLHVTNPSTGARFNPYFYFTQNYQALNASYRNHQRRLASVHGSAKTLFIFFNVARDVIGGGMLSINRFAKRTAELIAGNKSAAVVISGVPLINEAVKHTQFEAYAEQIDFNLIVEQCLAEDVHIFIPEVFALEFEAQLNALQRKWLYSRRKLNVVILNQNNDLMPTPDVLQQCFSSLPGTLRISTAHRSYCTQRLASHYCLPVKQLTPYLPPMEVRKHSQKEKIIMVSQDPIERSAEGLTRDEVIRQLSAALPEYRFVMVQNMSIDLYLELASNAMFSITFGEGLDGYFIEPILSGGVSFAVFNSAFFPREMADCPTLYTNWPNLINNVVGVIKELAADPNRYEALSRDLRVMLGRLYSKEISDGDLIALLGGKADYYPGPKRRDVQAFPDGAKLLQEKSGVRVTNAHSRVQNVILPNGSPLDHFGGYAYVELADCYTDGVFNLKLDKRKQYVLVDATAGAGIVSSYLLDRHANISKAYLFEGADQTAYLTQQNILNSKTSSKIRFKQIFLGDSYFKRTVRFHREWASWVSPYSEASNAYIEDQCRASEERAELTELEVASASDEIGDILKENPQSNLIVRINNEQMANTILSDLTKTGCIGAVDTIIITLPFIRNYEGHGLLAALGFRVEAVSSSSNFYSTTVIASRKTGVGIQPRPLELQQA